MRDEEFIDDKPDEDEVEDDDEDDDNVCSGPSSSLSSSLEPLVDLRVPLLSLSCLGQFCFVQLLVGAVYLAIIDLLRLIWIVFRAAKTVEVELSVESERVEDASEEEEDEEVGGEGIPASVIFFGTKLEAKVPP